MTDDTNSGGDELSIDEAAAAYAKATTSEVDTDQTDIEDDDEGVESDGEADDEDQVEDGDEDTDPESDQGRFVSDNAKIRLPDGTITTIADLKSGSLRNADYTRKTQELAEQRRSFEGQSESVKQAEQQLSQQREYMTSLLQSITPQAPDPSLLQSDPMEHMQQKEQYERFAQHLQYLQQESGRTQQEGAEKQQREHVERVNSEWGVLVGKVPELKEQTKAQAFADDIRKYGQEAYGFSLDELKAQIPGDHRMALVIKDAIAYRKLQASKPKVAQKVEGRPPVQRGGKRFSPKENQARRANDAYSRLRKTGSVEDAAAAYLASQKG